MLELGEDPGPGYVGRLGTSVRGARPLFVLLVMSSTTIGLEMLYYVVSDFNIKSNIFIAYQHLLVFPLFTVKTDLIHKYLPI